MVKVKLLNGSIVIVDKNEAHRLIDQEGASLYNDSFSYDNKMMKTGGVANGAQRKRTYHSR